MSGLVPMITRDMIKYDPINHTIWFEAAPATARPEARRVLTGLAAAAVAARLALMGAARVATR